MEAPHQQSATPGDCPASIIVLTLAPRSECLIKHSSHSSHLLLYISLSLTLSIYLCIPSLCAETGCTGPLSCLHRTQSPSRGSARKKAPVYFCMNLLSVQCSVESEVGDFCPTNTDYLSQFDQIQTYQICFRSKPRSQSVTPNPLIISINKVYYIFLLKDYEHFGVTFHYLFNKKDYIALFA